MKEPQLNLKYVAPVFCVTDLARSLSYYRNALGFEVEFDYEGFYAGILCDGCRIHLKCSPPPMRDQAAFEAAEHLDAPHSHFPTGAAFDDVLTGLQRVDSV